MRDTIRHIIAPATLAELFALGLFSLMGVVWAAIGCGA